MADIEKREDTDNVVTLNVAGNGQEAEEVKVQISRLPFNFAKRHHVLISKSNDQYTLHCLANVNSAAVLELRRVLKSPFAI